MHQKYAVFWDFLLHLFCAKQEKSKDQTVGIVWDL